jgi:hypothetical protein
MLTTTMGRLKMLVETDLKLAHISARQLAFVVGITPTRLGNAISDRVYLGSDKERDIEAAAKLLLRLEMAVRPLRLPDDAEALRNLHDYVRENNIDPEKIRDSIDVLFGVASE